MKSRSESRNARYTVEMRPARETLAPTLIQRHVASLGNGAKGARDAAGVKLSQ